MLTLVSLNIQNLITHNKNLKTDDVGVLTQADYLGLNETWVYDNVEVEALRLRCINRVKASWKNRTSSVMIYERSGC